MSPGADRATADDTGVTGATTQFGDHGSDHHLLHLIGDPRDGEDHLVADRAHQPRRCTGLLGDTSGTNGHEGLAQVVARHAATPGSEHLEQTLYDLFVLDQGDAHDLGDDITGDVILGRTETAAHDDCVAAFQRHPQRRSDPLPVVAHLGLEVAVDPSERELLADPRGIGVDDLTEEQFGADGDDFAVHWIASRALVLVFAVGRVHFEMPLRSPMVVAARLPSRMYCRALKSASRVAT